NDKNVLLTMNKYSANNPGQIEEIILFDNKGEMTKIYHYTDNKLKSIKELNTIIPEETLVQTKVFHSGQEAEELVSIVENKRYTKDTEAI
ncbi:MAG: hypothetical protein Q8850_02155, partial [Candidatus Phytoplasma australasiaticum]|nr:hypothetical protein [Candidatus Phytoplasma australasiaticum]